MNGYPQYMQASIIPKLIINQQGLAANAQLSWEYPAINGDTAWYCHWEMELIDFPHGNFEFPNHLYIWDGDCDLNN